MSNSISKLSNLQQRLIFGIAGAAILLTAIWFSHWSFFGLFMLICFLSLKEFHSISKSAGISMNTSVGIFIGTLLYGLSCLISIQFISEKVYAFFPAFITLLFLVELFHENTKPFERTAFSILGIIYTVIPYVLLNYISFQSGAYNYKVPLGILFLLWANDTGGYFGGKFFGKHKLYERISPKKTWEGSFSGLLLALGIAYCLFLYIDSFTLSFWLGLAVLIVVTGSLGDLIESQFKRSLNLKDSGSSIPGHGGFLDRFDGLIIALPFVMVYFLLFS